MSVVPEYILQTTVVRGIKRMRNDTRLIDQLFKNLDQKSIGQIRSFIKTQAIDLCINYPREPLKVPAIVILLKGEKENQAFLGDSMGMDIPDEFSFDSSADAGILGGTASVSSLSGNPKVVFGPFTALTGTENTLRIATKEWIADQFMPLAHIIRIVHGTGVGQIRNVVGNSGTVVMVDRDWLTIPDSTTVFEIALPPTEVLGEASTLYDRTEHPVIERKGGLYDLNYQMQVVGPNPEMTIYLTVILKGIFTAFRTFLEGQGVINLAMSATDFTPRPEYQPDLSYLRALNMDFIFPFDTFEGIGGLATSLRLLIEGEPTSFSIATDPVLSDTTFEITKGSTTHELEVVNNLSDVQRIYFGSATPPMTVDANFIQNILVSSGGTLLSSTRQHNINYIAGVGQHLYYVIPTRFGGSDGDFIDNGTHVDTGFFIVTTLELTTSFGTEMYNVWVSDSPGLGFVSVGVR